MTPNEGTLAVASVNYEQLLYRITLREEHRDKTCRVANVLRGALLDRKAFPQVDHFHQTGVVLVEIGFHWRHGVRDLWVQQALDVIKKVVTIAGARCDECGELVRQK